MKDNSYLYGDNVEVPTIPQDIIDKRVELLKAHLEKLLNHSYYTRDTTRVNKVIKAIDFWEKINDN